MLIANLRVTLNKSGFDIKRLYQYSSSDFSVLHAEAAKDFLDRPLGLHEYYCDMKRLEKLKVGEVAITLYNPSSGFATEVKVGLDSVALAEVIQAIEYGLVEQVLIFELTHHTKTKNLLPVPAGKVYQVVKL